MFRPLEERLYLQQIHVRMCTSQGKDLPHADARAQRSEVISELIGSGCHIGILAGETTDVAKRDDPEAVLAALGEVFDAISSSGFDLDQVLQTINRHAVELSGADFGNILRSTMNAGTTGSLPMQATSGRPTWTSSPSFRIGKTAGP